MARELFPFRPGDDTTRRPARPHVGIPIGQAGADVAREAFSLVLWDRTFPTPVEATRTGRRVYDNLRKAPSYAVAIHVAITGEALVPVEIVLLELIIDPASSLVFEAEPEERDVIGHPPRDPAEPLLGARPPRVSLLLGGWGLAVALGVYLGAIELGHPTGESCAPGFAALIAVNLAMVFVSRCSSASVVRSFGGPNSLA